MKIVKNLFITAVACGVLFSVFAIPLSAQISDKVQGTIIFDFTGKKDEPASVYIFGGKKIDEIITRLGLTVQGVIIEGRKRKLFLEKLKKKYKRGTENRWISKKSDKLEVFAFYKKPKVQADREQIIRPKITFEEISRKTRLSKDISVLLKIAVVLGTKREKGEASDTRIELAKTTYRLKKRRAVLIVSADSGAEKSGKIEVITGSTERWFLSADLPVAKLSSVKFVQGKGIIEPRETPKEVHIGLNCMIGDILKERQNLLKNFFIKGMLKMSKRPLDSYGIGIGFRFPKIRSLGIEISSFSIFASVIWSKEETEDKTKNLRKHQFLFGISYNLDKAMGWTK